MNQQSEFDYSATSTAASNPVPAINHEELLQRCMGNLSLAERVLERFSSEFSGKLTDLRGLVDKGDDQEILRMTHQLKGTAANIAAHRLQACLAALHESSEKKSWDRVQSLVDRLAEEFIGFEAARPMLAIANATKPDQE